MANLSWLLDMDAKVYSIIKAKAEKPIKKLHPNVFFTNSSANPTTTRFPTIYFKNIGTIETGETNEADTIECAVFTYEIQVKINTDVDDYKEVMLQIIEAFNSLKFRLVTMSDPIYGDDILTGVARFRREIGKDDIL